MTQPGLVGNSPAAVNARKTHCKRGHEFTEENTMRSGGGRICRTCKRTNARLAAEARRRARGVRTRQPTAETDLARFQAKIRIDPSGCWIWTSTQDGHGYGQIQIGGRAGGMQRAYRWAYEHFIGPIPEGLHLDHLCRVRLCVNPEHLEPVTVAENNRRALAAKPTRTHCRKGHELTPENTYVHEYSYGTYRACKRCTIDRVDARRKRLRNTA